MSRKEKILDDLWKGVVNHRRYTNVHAHSLERWKKNKIIAKRKATRHKTTRSIKHHHGSWKLQKQIIEEFTLIDAAASSPIYFIQTNLHPDDDESMQKQHPQQWWWMKRITTTINSSSA